MADLQNDNAGGSMLHMAIAPKINPTTQTPSITHINSSGQLYDAGAPSPMGIDKQARRDWYEHWMHKGFEALESLLHKHLEPGAYCHGDKPTLADVCLVPQISNARQNDLDLSEYPTLRRIYRTCMSLSAFQSADPEAQQDRLDRAVAGR